MNYALIFKIEDVLVMSKYKIDEEGDLFLSMIEELDSSALDNIVDDVPSDTLLFISYENDDKFIEGNIVTLELDNTDIPVYKYFLEHAKQGTVQQLAAGLLASCTLRIQKENELNEYN